MTAALIALLVGAALGFVLSIPAAGPLLALVVLAGTRGETRRGLSLAIGGALAEAGWALLALWGLAEVLAAHARWIPALRVVSALLLVAIAVLLWRTPGGSDARADGRGAPALLGFSLVALNPGFPLTWGTVAGALYSSRLLEPGSTAIAPLAIGVFAGIIAWFSLVLAVSRRLGRTLDARAHRRWSRAVAVVLVAGAAWLALLAVRG